MASKLNHLGRDEAIRVLYRELAAVPNAHRVAALEELAKHCEHRVRDHRSASEYVRTALLIANSPELRHREARLEKKVHRWPSCGGAGEEPGLLL
jgi:hypothetical protein